MQRGHTVLISSGIVLIFGILIIVLLAEPLSSLMETEFLIQPSSLFKDESIEKQLFLEQGEGSLLSIFTSPADAQANVKVNDPDGILFFEDKFYEIVTIPIRPETTGSFNVIILNEQEQPLSLYATLTSMASVEDSDIIRSLSMGVAVGLLLIFFSIIGLIAGAVILVYDKRKLKK